MNILITGGAGYNGRPPTPGPPQPRHPTPPTPPPPPLNSSTQDTPPSS